MTWDTLKGAIARLTGAHQTDGEEVVLSRRAVLTGFGIASACAVAGPALFWSDEAEADVTNVQYRGDRHRGRGRYDHHRRPRHSRSDIRRRCRDRRYRRRNERLCAYARGRGGRHGTCVSVGPIRICD